MLNLKDRVIGVIVKLLSVLSIPMHPARPALQRIPVRINSVSNLRRRR